MRALELDGSLAEPHASLGYVKLYFEWDWPGAETEFRRAIELDASYAATHQWYSIYLLAAGRAKEFFERFGWRANAILSRSRSIRTSNTTTTTPDSTTRRSSN